MTGIMAHKIVVTRKKRRQAILLTEYGVSKDTVRSHHTLEEEGRMTPYVASFCTTRLAACTHLLLNVMRSKTFLSHLILTLSWCLKNKIRSRWEKFAPSYNPFFRIGQITILAQLGSWETPHLFSPETLVKLYQRWNQRRAARDI